ncbi:MAG: tRNA (guanosine(46)-N7)-methyltransferase TrmB [Campylobacterota bacterium]|nr:tRNA (guanosine(46)-N7)-methyltransferase TrmB [Campylobacterota bacterium]
MPHISIEQHNDIEVNEVFPFVLKGKQDEKICVNLDNKEFLITKVKKEHKYLMKLDGTTRLTPVSLMKDALNRYAEVSKAKVISSNTNSIYKKLEPEEKYIKTIDYFANDFNTSKEIWVEVGFGSGVHLLHQAKQNPDKIIIGLEIHYPSIEQVLKAIKLQNIENVLVLNYDARLFLEFLKSNSVGRVFVHFPVPWDKKPHRRVMSVEFIEECMRVLKIDGTLELRTDSPNYFEYSSLLLNNFKDYKHKILENVDIDITSKYEARWKKQEKTIWDITIYSKDNSDDISYDLDFTFPAIYEKDKIKKSINIETIITKEYLINFESYYETKDGEVLIFKVTFGSFNRPVSKYLLLQNNKIRYFQGEPIKTKINLIAHKAILEVLQ